MNVWENAVITDQGLSLLAKLIEGNSLIITRAETGTGFVTPGMLRAQTSVSEPAQALGFQPASYPELGKCSLPCCLTNDSVETGYVATQVGIYALDPDLGEILYYIAQSASKETGTIVPSKDEMPGYSAEWNFYFQYGLADGVEVTVDPTNTVTLSGMKAYVALKIANHGVITNGTGRAYSVDLPDIGQLEVGTTLLIIPHETSTITNPTLNVNGIGNVPLRMLLTSDSGATVEATNPAWLQAGKPVRVMYDGECWKTTDLIKTDASSLHGVVAIKNGGTGADTEQGARENLDVPRVVIGDEKPKGPALWFDTSWAKPEEPNDLILILGPADEEGNFMLLAEGEDWPVTNLESAGSTGEPYIYDIK